MAALTFPRVPLKKMDPEMRRRTRVRIGLVLLAVLVALSAAVPRLQADPGTAADRQARQELTEIAVHECRQVLGPLDCLFYDVEITDLDDPLLGMIQPHYQTRIGRSDRVRTTSGIFLDSDLLEADVELQHHVATHEWYHVRAEQLFPGEDEHAAFDQRAVDYYGTTDGNEILTDCATYEAAPDRSVYSHDQQTDVACRDWRSLYAPLT